VPAAKQSCLADALIQSRKTALLKKFRAGGRLTKEQLDEIRHELPPGAQIPAASSAFAATQQELAQRLGISRKTITNHSKDAGAPVPSADGRYDVEAWRGFLQKRGIVDDPEEPKNWKHELDRLKCAEIELRMEQERRELVPMGEVLAAAGRTFSAFRTALNQLAGRCAQGVVKLKGYDAIRKFIDTEIRMVLSGLQEGSFLDEPAEVIGEVESSIATETADDIEPERSSTAAELSLSNKPIKRTRAKKKRARK
jgi:predicted RNA-binding protein YlqC (UPF0109 family)/DNA-binding transcriptional regulator YiaG